MRDDPKVATVAGLERSAGTAVSVVMPVHNALPYLDEAVRSILAQSHRDFEFVIGDDASTDGSTEALRAWARRDPRIRLLERRDNLGPVGSSNWVARAARGAFIARMDADDLAHPDRLARQIGALEADPAAVLIGSPPVGIDHDSRIVREQVRWSIGRNNFNAPFAHGSTMFRRAAFEAVGGYREPCVFWEDLDLYLRLGAIGKVLVQAEALHGYRFAHTSTRLTSSQDRVEAAVSLMLRCRARFERGEGYDDLLVPGAGSGTAARTHPLVFLSIGFGRIWSGSSPAMLSRMLRRAAFPRDRRAALIWAIMVWGTVSPKTLRYALQRRLAKRNRAASGRIRDGAVHDWLAGAAPKGR